MEKDRWKSAAVKKKARFLYQQIKSTRKLQGHTAEIGVYRGGSSKLIRLCCPCKTHYCYDTFSGIAMSDPSVDFHSDGEFSCGLGEVMSVVGSRGVKYRVGVFPSSFMEHDEWFSFVHSDTDTYAGAAATLEVFSGRMVAGGKILFDDYGWQKCPGIEKAVSEFLNSNVDFEFTASKKQCVLKKRFRMLLL